MGSPLGPGLVQKRTKGMLAPLLITFLCPIYVRVKNKNMAVTGTPSPDTRCGHNNQVSQEEDN